MAMTMIPRDNQLGRFLRDRRARIDPATLGIRTARRRTPGLRREEVAQRANVSATWYTWLEQGRGGAPSADTLDRLAEALLLTPTERELLFLMAQNRPPEITRGHEHGLGPGQGHSVSTGVTPRLRRLLDSLAFSPAFVRTPTWDIVAWNHAAAVVLTDYGAYPPERRNLLRLLFSGPDAQRRTPDWESDARHAVAAFRLTTARAGMSQAVAALVDELCGTSPEFASMWLDNDVSTSGEGIKQLEHPGVGPLALEFSTFAVDDQPDLGLVVYTPATSADLDRVRALVGG